MKVKQNKWLVSLACSLSLMALPSIVNAAREHVDEHRMRAVERPHSMHHEHSDSSGGNGSNRSSSCQSTQW